MKTARLILFSVVLAFRLVLGASPEPASNPWETIKEYAYQKRADFSAGANRLVGKVDDEIRELNIKRQNLPETSTKDWDFAMSELKAARDYLKSTIAELDDVTMENWAGAKEKVGKAWQSSQEAYDKVRTSTTS